MEAKIKQTVKVWITKKEKKEIDNNG